MQPISRPCSRECCFVLIIPIDSYCRQWQNDRPTPLCCGYQTVRKHSYHDREMPEQAASLLAEQKPGLIGARPRLQKRIPERSKQVFLIVIERTNSLFIVSFVARFLRR